MRRLISLVSVTIALAGLGFVLVNATTVDRRPPSVKTISLSAPTGDPQVAQILSAIDIEFSEPVRTETAEVRFHINPVVDGTFSWNGSSAIFTPSRKLPQDTTFTISIAPGVEDLEGNADPVGLEAWTFTTVGSPFVIRATPADGASGVPLDGTIELVFDRLMDTTSVERAISLTPAATVTAAWNGSIVTLQLGPGLLPGTLYTLTVDATAADTGGSRLRAPYRQTFTTVGAGLNVTAVIPADGVAGIGIGSAIAIRFDGPIDPSTALSAIHVTPSVDGDVRVVGLDGDGASLSSPSVPGSGDMLVLVPSSPLAPHTTYSVTVDPTVARVGDPEAVTIGRTWSFTTGAPTQSGQNQVAFLGARGGVRNVWIMNPDGTNQRELTVELLPVSSYDTTADGSRIVYAAGGIVSTMAIDGSELQRLTANDGRLEYAPALVPGDQWVVVARRDASGTDQGYWLVPMPGTGGTERQLLDHGAPDPGSASETGDGINQFDGTPIWAPRIAFQPAGGKALLVTASGDAQVVDVREPDLLEGGLDAPIQLPLVGEAAPVWVSDRNAFVLAAAPASGGDRTLFVVGASGRAEAIAGTTGAAGPVAISATGALAYVVRNPAGQAVVQVMAADGTIREIQTLAGRDDRWPAFAPDARTVLVGRSLASQPKQSDGIWAVDLPTGQARRLTVDGAYARWVP